MIKYDVTLVCVEAGCDEEAKYELTPLEVSGLVHTMHDGDIVTIIAKECNEHL